MKQVIEATRTQIRERSLRAAVCLGRRFVAVNLSVESQLERPARRGQPLSILVVGVDARSRPRRKYAKIVQGRATGARADSIVLVVVAPREAATLVVSVPRGVGVSLPKLGYQRLGWGYDYGGASMLVRAVKDLLRVPIHHYIEFDFQGFAELVDAFSGIDLDLEFAVQDRRSGLDLGAGPQRLDGMSTLALVRSRHQEFGAKTGPFGDVGRRRNLTTVIEALRNQLADGIRPVRVLRLAFGASRHIAVDERFASSNLMSLAGSLRSSSLEFLDLPTNLVVPNEELASPFPPYQRSGSAYLELEPEADDILESIRQRLRG